MLYNYIAFQFHLKQKTLKKMRHYVFLFIQELRKFKNFIGNITLFQKENRKIIDCIRMYKNVIYFMFALQQYLLELFMFRDYGPCNKPFFFKLNSHLLE